MQSSDTWADLDISGALLASDGQQGHMYELDLLHMDEQPLSTNTMWHELDALTPTQYISAPPAPLNALPQPHWLGMPSMHSLPLASMQPPPPPPPLEDPPRRRPRLEEEADPSNAKPRRKISVTREWLEANGFFDMRARDAAMKLGIGVTTLKRYCRSDLQLDRWPWRKRVGASKATRKRSTLAEPPRRSNRRPFDADDDEEEHSSASDHDEGVPTGKDSPLSAC